MKNKTQFIKIDQVLSQVGENKKIKPGLVRYQVLSCWYKIVETFMEAGREQTRALDFKKGVLFVACLSREIAYQIKILTSRMVHALNQVLGKQLVFTIAVEF